MRTLGTIWPLSLLVIAKRHFVRLQQTSFDKSISHQLKAFTIVEYTSCQFATTDDVGKGKSDFIFSLVINQCRRIN